MIRILAIARQGYPAKQVSYHRWAAPAANKGQVMAYPINAPNSSTEASLTGQQDQSDPKTIGKRISSGLAQNTELLRLRIFTIGIQELAYLATSRGKQVYRRHRNLSPHSWLRIPLTLSERKDICLIPIPFGQISTRANNHRIIGQGQPAAWGSRLLGRQPACSAAAAGREELNRIHKSARIQHLGYGYLLVRLSIRCTAYFTADSDCKNSDAWD